MNVKVKLVNKHKSATADLWHYSGTRCCIHVNMDVIRTALSPAGHP